MRILKAVICFGLLLMAAAIVLGIVAIWTVGDNSGRYGATAGGLGFIGLGMSWIGGFLYDVERISR